MNDELNALILLTTLPKLGSVRIRSLIAHFGSPTKALNASYEAVCALPGFNKKWAEGWGEWENYTKVSEKNIGQAQRHGVTILPYTDPEYPKKLLEIPDYPLILYVKGEIQALKQRSIAIIGTRNATLYGREMAQRIASDLASAGFVVVSGLARGIDTAAHQGALETGRTLAIIGSGLGNIYPVENQRLADEISKKGAMVSEFGMNVPPDRQNFPQRNRIVSGITMATLLIEAPLKSGAMITMEQAFSQRRTLFALPGRVDVDSFKGNHSLIKNNRAQLVENSEDIIYYFDDLIPKQSNPFKEFSIPLTEEERHLLAHMPKQESSFEEMSEVSGYSPSQLNICIAGLLLKKAIKEFPGKVYKKLEFK